MQDSIVCPHCKKVIPFTQALSHQLKEKFEKEKNFELEKLKIELNKKAQEWKVEQIRKIEAEKSQMGKIIKQEMDLEIRNKANEIGELKKQNHQLQEQFLELNKLIRQLKNENEQSKIEMEKRIVFEQQKIRQDEQKRIEQEYRFKMLEKDKKIEDAHRLAEEYKRKLEQGSQQLQGEVLELELESLLRREFPFDDILPVPKGIRGADVLQIVKNNQGRVCGKIIWESKRTRSWSNGWIGKLKEDKRQVNCDIAVIISQVLPEGMAHFGQHEGVVIGTYEMILGLAIILREKLLEVSALKVSMVGKQEKKEILWNYLTGMEFRHRLDAISEAYSQMQNDLEVEKRWFVKKWAKQEKMMRMVIDNILGMHGDLQSIVGKVLPEMKGLDLLNPPAKKEEGGGTLF